MLFLQNKYYQNYLKEQWNWFFLDLTESNYLDYHTGTRFTFYAKNVRGEVARGGRYLSKKDSEIQSSTGFTCYMDTIIRASSLEENISIPICLTKTFFLLYDFLNALPV